MKNLRGLLAALLAVTMLCTVAVVVYAAAPVNYDVTEGTATKTVTVPGATGGNPGVNKMNCYGAVGCTVTVVGVDGVSLSNGETEATLQNNQNFSFALVENGNWGNCQITFTNSNASQVKVTVTVEVALPDTEGTEADPRKLDVTNVNEATLDGTTTGYYYTWRATGEGRLTLQFASTSSWQYTLTNVTQETTQSGSSAAGDPDTLELWVAFDEQIKLCVNTEAGAAGTVSVAASFWEHTHAWTEAGRAEPGCTTVGQITYTCDCNLTMTEEIPAAGHTAGDAVIENEVPATCTVAGSYDRVVCCTVCGSELNRDLMEIPAEDHIPGEVVRENETPATCTTAGACESVTYCTVCQGEASREATVLPPVPHGQGTPVVEAEVAPTCATNGAYDSVVYCVGCNAEVSRQKVIVSAVGHTWNEAGRVNPTCTEEGKVTYQCACGEKTEEVIPMAGHAPGEAVKENEVQPSTTAPGSYDEVFYCEDCGALISRTTKAIPQVITPQTADITPMAVLAGAVIGAAGIAAVVVSRKKRI